MQDPGELKKLIQRWSEELGFDGIGVTGVDISEDERYLNKWLKNKFHGSMNYMEKHTNEVVAIAPVNKPQETPIEDLKKERHEGWGGRIFYSTKITKKDVDNN